MFVKIRKKLRDLRRPDDYTLASRIASTIDGSLEFMPIDQLREHDWYIGLDKNVSASVRRFQTRDSDVASATFTDLPESENLLQSREVDHSDGSLTYMSTDALALAVLARLKEQLES